MTTVNIHEAKTHLSRLLNRVSQGEEIVIAKSGQPLAKLVPIHPPPKRRPAGRDAGKVWVSDDFDRPLPERILGEFER